MLIRLTYLIVLFCAANQAHAQITDTTFALEAVEVTTVRLEHFTAGAKTVSIDSAQLERYPQSSLAEVLSNESPVFIKSYGLGSLATTSFRGGSANHTAVLWNGFQLNSVSNGMIDLSLVPTSFSDDVSLQFGGSSALWGSGAVGGAIHLNNRPRFNDGWRAGVGASAASFSDYRQNAHASYSSKRSSTRLAFINRNAKNDFEYSAASDEERIWRQENAAFDQLGILAEQGFKINARQQLTANVWYQETDREIPPSLLEGESKAEQEDQSMRTTLQWQRAGDRVLWQVRGAYFDEQLSYSDPQSDINTNSRIKSYKAQVETKVALKPRHHLNIGLAENFYQAEADNFSDSPTQNRLALFASYSYATMNQKWRVNANVRQELVDSETTPLVYSLGANYQPISWLGFHSNVSRVFRLPNFNDLYWNSGGNPNLDPEIGFSQEIGVKLNSPQRWKHWKLSFTGTGFNRIVENWIIWLPQGGYWTPRNIMEVWSRGIETTSEIVYRIQKLKLRAFVTTNYVVSTNEQALSASDASIDKQLIYTPMYSGFGGISLDYHEFSITLNRTYTGYRYTSTDNTQYLEPYWLTDIFASYKIDLKSSEAKVFARLNNVFDLDYQVIQNRLMPGRNWQVGLQFNFHKQFNKTST